MIAWCDITLCPPPENVRVLVCCQNLKGFQSVNIGYFYNGIFHGMGSSSKVTHWMKLPKLPKLPEVSL